MRSSPAQPSLFDNDPVARDAMADAARAQMREMIDKLRNTDIPPWKDQMGVILDDGTFKRAMWEVPKEEGEALWAEYDPQMERLFAIWAATQEAPQG